MDLIIEKNYGVLHLTFNRHQKRNALSIALCNSLREALESAKDNPSIRVVQIDSEQEVFCAGADMEEMLKMPEALNQALDGLFRTLLHFTKPIVASVKGPCVGEGLALLLFADMVYASKEAVFSYPATALARTQRFGIAHWYGRCPQPKLLAQKILLAEPISAFEAESLGLVTQVFELDDLAVAVANKLARLVVLPPNAVQATREALLRDFIRGVEQDWERDQAIYNEQAASAEAEEALNAFMEGRKPVFAPES